MSIDSIIKHIVDEDIISAKKETEALLYSKLNDALEYHKTNIISDTYADAIGLASMSEKKKTDDGDGLDAVGDEDGDIDNDGDSDDSDDYLNNRRKTVGKAIKKKKKNGDDEEEEEEEEVDESRAIDLVKRVGRAVGGHIKAGGPFAAMARSQMRAAQAAREAAREREAAASGNEGAQFKSRAASRGLRGVETNPDLNQNAKKPIPVSGHATNRIMNTPSNKITPSMRAAARREQGAGK